MHAWPISAYKFLPDECLQMAHLRLHMENVVLTSFVLQVWITSMLSQHVTVSEDMAVHNPPPPLFQVGCPQSSDRGSSLESLTETREREVSFEGIPGITPNQVNPRNDSSKISSSFSHYYICCPESSWTLDRKPLRASHILHSPFTQLRSYMSNKTFYHHRCIP